MPSVTISTCPFGWVCQLVLAPGSKVTLPAEKSLFLSLDTRGVRNALPVNHSSGTGFPWGKSAAVSISFVLDCWLQAVIMPAANRINIFGFVEVIISVLVLDLCYEVTVKRCNT